LVEANPGTRENKGPNAKAKATKAKTRHDEVPPKGGGGGAGQPRICQVGFGFQEDFKESKRKFCYPGRVHPEHIEIDRWSFLNQVDRLSSASAVFQVCTHLFRWK
jgi:hypothetical protein